MGSDLLPQWRISTRGFDFPKPDPLFLKPATVGQDEYATPLFLTILPGMDCLRAFLLSALLFLAGCALAEEEQGTPAVTEVPVIPTAANTPALEETPSTPEPSVSATQPITLTIWTTQEIAPISEAPGGPTLMEQLSAFDTSHPDVDIFVELKTIADQGGILSYLRTGRSVAPAILPDVVLLPAEQLPVAASQGLIHPIDDILEPDADEDLYAAGRDLMEINEERYGYPFAFDNLQHLVYRSTTITETLPTAWPALVSDESGTLLFPAAGPSGAEFILQYYRANGGTLLNEAGQPSIQAETLTSTLADIQTGVSSGFVDSESGNVATIEQAWQIFQNNPAYVVQTTATHFLRQVSDGDDATYQAVPLPGPGGPLPPAVDVWTWAISTPDPARQAVSGELISWLTSGSNMGQWSLQSGMLPARRTAFDVWPDNDYVAFLRRQLDAAQPALPGSIATVLSAFSDATTSVILGLSTPQESAEQAATAIQP